MSKRPDDKRSLLPIDIRNSKESPDVREKSRTQDGRRFTSYREIVRPGVA